jgi:ubiquinone/menaquinone biosynthesis C-methylase UbiE
METCMDHGTSNVTMVDNNSEMLEIARKRAREFKYNYS